MSKQVRDCVTMRDVVRDDPLLPIDLTVTVVAVAAFLAAVVA